MAERENTTLSADIKIKAREIDFVEQFTKNWQHLLDLLGIMRMTKKENGSTLRTKTVKVALQSGDVGEGEVIPYSKATVTEKDAGTVAIKKWSKGVSIEAIADKGYENAVADTDEELRNEVQNVVVDYLYKELKSGTLINYADSFQMALATAKGRVLNRFKSMHRSVTEVVGFANVLDAYEYIGAANITTQSAFGVEYLQNFLGYRTVFLLGESELPRGTVIATASKNIMAYYVDPADSEFAKSGLTYTTVGETPFIGFHTQGNYTTAVSESFVLMGIRAIPEYKDAIAVITFGSGFVLNGSVDIASDTDLLGKVIGDLQKDIVVTDNMIKGTLKYVTGYTGFSGDEEEQSGNYLALKVTATEGTTITCQMIGGEHPDRVVTLDSDGIIIVRVTDTTEGIKFTATYDTEKVSKAYSLSEITLESEE